MNKNISKNGLFRRLILLVIFFSLVIIPFSCVSVGAQENQSLAAQYAPILYFTSAESLYPVDVNYHIDNSLLYQYTSEGPQLHSQPPFDVNLGNITGSESFILDNQAGTVDDDGVITDYQSEKSTYGYTVYARIYTSGSTTIIQYWMFYAFNKGPLNIHEGDWEMVQVILSSDTPTEVGYSQHHSGQKATWDQVEKEETHFNVYVAEGTHANYLRSYSGVLGAASDTVGANGLILEPGDYTIELLENQEWLGFEGRWGEYESLEAEVRGRAGPQGPMFREEGLMWNSPMAWSDSLPAANNMMFIFELILYYFIWIFIIVTALTLAFLGYRIYNQKKKSGLGPRVLSILYIDKADLKSIGNILCLVGIVIAIFGLIYPWYNVSADIQIEGQETEGMVDLISIDGMEGVQVNLLDSNGPTQLGTFALPFSLLIGIGLVFFIIKLIGIDNSKKLGKSYIYQGIRLLIPVIVILIAIIALSSMDLGIPDAGGEDLGIEAILSEISSSPIGGEQTISYQEVPGQILMQWGLGLGAILLLLAGIILIISGILLVKSKAKLY